jgi:hypothetical protein
MEFIHQLLRGAVGAASFSGYLPETQRDPKSLGLLFTAETSVEVQASTTLQQCPAVSA